MRTSVIMSIMDMGYVVLFRDSRMCSWGDPFNDPFEDDDLDFAVLPKPMRAETLRERLRKHNA